MAARSLRQDIHHAVREAYEVRGKLDMRETALIGARVALARALAAVKSVRLVPSSPHEKLISRLLLARITKAISEANAELDTMN